MHWHHCEEGFHIGNQLDYSQHAMMWLLHFFSRPNPGSSWDIQRNCMYTFSYKWSYLEKENIYSEKKNWEYLEILSLYFYLLKILKIVLFIRASFQILLKLIIIQCYDMMIYVLTAREIKAMILCKTAKVTKMVQTRLGKRNS